VHWRPKTADDASTGCQPDDVGRTTDYWVQRHADSEMSRVVSLKSIRSDTRSQWSPESTVVMCSERRRPEIDLAAAFMTDWRRRMRRTGSTDSTAFPQSSFVSTSDAINVC
jgi:hypothetical protein